MSITVYEKNMCPKCSAVQRELTKKGVDYSIVNMDENPHLFQEFKDQGLMEAPIVDIDGKKHSGFRPDLLRKLHA